MTPRRLYKFDPVSWLFYMVWLCSASCAFLSTRAQSTAVRDGLVRPANWNRWRLFATGEEHVGPSPAIYPTERITVRMDHARHMRLPNVQCETCHQNASQSASVRDRLIPTEQTCVPCHPIDRNDINRATPASGAVARCDGCHENFDPSRPRLVAMSEVPAANLKFSHRVHHNRGVRCETCHTDVRTKTLATRDDLPTMRTCFSCHRDGSSVSNACVTCHLTEPDGVIRTHFAEGWLNPPPWMPGLHHDPDFWVTHRTSAADNGGRCSVCHRESDCIDCHDGRVRDRRVHPNDFLTQHPVQARQQMNNCESCHRTASFCQTCHLRMGVAMGSPVYSRATGRFHPPAQEWSSRFVGVNHHALEARRSLATCVSCHTERDCTTCHATVGLGGAGSNPHPPGFRAQCAGFLRAAPQMCLSCHRDTVSIQSMCQ